MAGIKSVEAYRSGLIPEHRETVDALRALAQAAGSDLVERIKWSAPSFARNGVDRITLGQGKGGTIRVILHRGAKALPDTGFVFDAPANLVTWAAPDRGVMTFASVQDVRDKADQIADVFRRWVETK